MANPAAAQPIGLTANEVTDFLATLNIMVQDANGDATYSNDKAMFGYVTQDQYLSIPVTFTDGTALGARAAALPNLTLDVIGSKDGITKYLGGTPDGANYRANTLYLYHGNPLTTARISYANYILLKNGGMSPVNAFIAGALRARWIALGCYEITAGDHARPYQERIVDDPTEHRRTVNGYVQSAIEAVYAARDFAAIAALDPVRFAEWSVLSGNDELGLSWVVYNAEIIWGAVEHVVRVRGHHYKDEYLPTYEKFYSATHEGQREFPEELDPAAVFRTSIHPFGLRALPIMAAHFTIHGKMGQAGIVRFSGAPAGVAVITSTAACLKSMASEAWFSRFQEVYGKQYEKVIEYEQAVLNRKFNFHSAARIYGVPIFNVIPIDGANVPLAVAKAEASAMASLAQGYINAMQEAQDNNVIGNFSFSNSKALKKHAGQAPIAAAKIRAIVIKGIEAVSEAKTMEQATDAVFPKTSEKKKEKDDKA